MKNQNLTEEIKAQILEMRSKGIRVPEIAKELGLSESGCYRVIQMDRIKELPLIDDSKVVQELREKVKKLEEENELLRADIRKLTDKLLTLI